MTTTICIVVGGGIGDFILASAWITELKRNLPAKTEFVLYSNCPEIAPLYLPWAKNNHSVVDFYNGRAKEHDFWIELSDVVRFQIRPGVALPVSLESLHKHWLGKLDEWGPLIAVHPHRTYQTARQALKQGLNRRTLPFHLMGLEPRRPTVVRLDGPNIPVNFVTVHDGMDSTHEAIKGRAMKTWGLEAWAELTRLLKAKGIIVVQLGGPKSRVIPGVDCNLIGQTTFRQSLNYLRESRLHIDGDSGLVHARAVFGGPSIVLFGPTSADYYGYPGNVNLKPRVCGECWWEKDNWMEKCVLEYSAPICMDSIWPEHVMEAIDATELFQMPGYRNEALPCSFA